MNMEDRKAQAFDQAIEEARSAEDAKRIHGEIWERFDKNRNRGKSFAYTNLLHDLAKYGPLLVPSLMSMKDLWQLITDTEEYIKGEEGNQQEDAREVIGSWLRGERELTRIPFEKVM